MKKLIIIPTYNEANNIEPFINSIFNLNLQDLDILVIDDNSPDQTANIIKNLQPQYNKLNLIEREGKLGLGSAYIAGFNWALENNFDLMIQMDADFSHNPTYLPEMIASAAKHDFVIGSRYVNNGGVENWPFFRKLLSKAGSLYARTILGVPINDFTGGFNAWKKEIFEKVILDDIKSNGYSFQIEMKYKAAKNDFKHKEIPIIFHDRTRDQSKMSKKIMLEAILQVPKMRFYESTKNSTKNS